MYTQLWIALQYFTSKVALEIPQFAIFNLFKIFYFFFIVLLYVDSDIRYLKRVLWHPYHILLYTPYIYTVRHLSNSLFSHCSGGLALFYRQVFSLINHSWTLN